MGKKPKRPPRSHARQWLEEQARQRLADHEARRAGAYQAQAGRGVPWRIKHQGGKR